MATPVTALIECHSANRVLRNQTSHLLEVIVTKNHSDTSFRVINNPNHVAIVSNHTNPPSHSDTLDIIDQLSTLAELNHLAYQQKNISIVTLNGIVNTSMMEITHINPKTLPNILKLESNRTSDDDTMDVHVWKNLPETIRDNWKHFNQDMQSYISQCFEHYHSSGASTLFSHKSPSVPVTLPQSTESYDLVMLLRGFMRHPQDKFQRHDPETDQYFMLSDLQPALTCPLDKPAFTFSNHPTKP